MSTVSRRFPLFKLPYVALNEVARHMNPAELLKLSLCSAVSKLVVKTVAVKLDEQYRLRVTLCPCLEIVFKRNAVKEDRFSYKAPTIGKEIHMLLFSIDTLKWAFELFGALKLSLIFHLGNGRDYDRLQFECAKKYRHLVFKVFFCNFEGPVEDDLALEFIELFKETRNLENHMQLNDGFKCDISLVTENLAITKGEWVTMENLWNFQADTFILKDVSFGNEDINRYLRDWKSGAKPNPKFRRCIIEGDGFKVAALLVGIDFLAPFEDENYKTILNDDQRRAIVVMESHDNGSTQVTFIFQQ